MCKKNNGFFAWCYYLKSYAKGIIQWWYENCILKNNCGFSW